MLGQKYTMRTPSGNFSNVLFLLLLKKIEYIGIQTKTRAKSLISKWNVIDAIIEEFIAKCDKIHQSLNKKQQWQQK